MIDEVSALEELERRRMYGKPPTRQPHPHENPDMICASFHRISVVQPENCYNCVHRHGYPQYLFGDENCDSFVESRIHTSAPAPEPATAPCPQHRIWQHCPVAAQVAKAERERAQQRIDAAIEQLSDINKYAREEYEEANLSDNEREMRIHLEYGNRVWGVVRFLRAQPEPQQEERR
jgi:hypothetical protein